MTSDTSKSKIPFMSLMNILVQYVEIKECCCPRGDLCHASRGWRKLDEGSLESLE